MIKADSKQIHSRKAFMYSFEAYLKMRAVLAKLRSAILNRSMRIPILVRVTCLCALQSSSYGQIEELIRFFQVSCKHTD